MNSVDSGKALEGVMGEETMTAREMMAQGFERAAEELEVATQHLRTAARHMHEQNVPRGCAHAFAAYGHIRSCERLIDENAILHAAKSEP